MTQSTYFLVTTNSKMAVLRVIMAMMVCVVAKGEIVNSALNKPAEMSSIYTANGRNYSAANAVDGNTSTVNPNIIHTATGQSSAWWKVDLLTSVHGATVKIYFRTDYTQRRRIQLYTSTTPFSSYPGTVSQRCYTYTLPVPDVLSVNCTGTWRYLLVYTDQDDKGGIMLDFAEVHVLVCSNGTYGTDCSKSCASRQCAETPTSCDRYTGECPSGGCKAGWMGPDCIQACTRGIYGHACNMSCEARNCNDSASGCHHVTGRCIGGCTAGWNGTDCTQTCSSGTYGFSCNRLCSRRQCVTSSTQCNHVTGQCQGGCEKGWTGTDCILECPHGTYGANCVKSCSDRRCKTPPSSCDHETGQCLDGCLKGWMGKDCVVQCPDGTYGQECISCSERHCQGESDCPEDGTCSGGCQDGWVLKNCTQGCASGTYGPCCGLFCGNCTNADICDHETGGCPSGCKPGWQGSQCKLGLQIIEKAGQDSVTSYVIGAVIGFLVAVVTGSVLLICLIRHGRIGFLQTRLQWKNSPISKGPKESAEMTDVSSPQAVDQHSSTIPVYNNDYAVLDSATKTENNDYDAIKVKYYENL